MSTLYQIENSDLSKCFSFLENYLQNEAKQQQLHEVESNIFKSLLDMGKIILNVFVNDLEQGKNIQFSNEHHLPLHSSKIREYLSIFGKIKIRRAYFWKQGFSGVYPLDAKLNLPKRLHSYLLDKWLQHRVTEEPFDQAIESISDLLNLKIAKRTVQQITNQASQEVESYYKQKGNYTDEGSHLIVQADCKGVIMIPRERPETKLTEEFTRRAKGVSKRGIKKDAVVTLDYSINPFERSPKGILEGLMNINSNYKKKKKEKKFDIRNKQIAGTMYGKKSAFENLAERLKARDSKCKKPIFILIDGASSLEKGLMQEFEKRGWEKRIIGCCLDIVHASEYLWDISTALYGEKSPHRVSWVRHALKKILNSNVKSIIKEIENKITKEKLNRFQVKRLNRSLTYFKNHKHMMDYKTYLKSGFPIASGGIEGACNNLVKGRTDRSGMQWTKRGAEAVIGLRSVQCNKDWEDYWEYYIQREFEEAYEKRVA